MKRLPAIAAIASIAVAAGAASASAPPALLTYSVVTGSRGAQARGGICLVTAHGRLQLTNRRRDDREPAWSPDGRRLAFARQQSNGRSVIDIYVLDVATRRLQNLSKSYGQFNTEPSWSPDARQIAFSARFHGSTIAIMRADGTQKRALKTDIALASSPSWSPDGKRIALAGSGGIYTVAVGGGKASFVASNSRDPAWSPDGKRLAYVRGNDLVVSDLDGTNAKVIAKVSSTVTARPQWSPSGRLIAFGARYGTKGVASMLAHTDGSGSRLLRGGTLDPTWRAPRTLPRLRFPACAG